MEEQRTKQIHSGQWWYEQNTIEYLTNYVRGITDLKEGDMIITRCMNNIIILTPLSEADVSRHNIHADLKHIAKVSLDERYRVRFTFRRAEAWHGYPSLELQGLLLISFAVSLVLAWYWWEEWIEQQLIYIPTTPSQS